MLGVIIALTTSLAWAGSSTILKYLSSRVSVFSINSFRLWVGSIVQIAVVLFSGRGSDIFQTHPISILLLALSGILASAGGDTLYIKSLAYLDVSRSYPLSQSIFPALTLVVAILFFAEPFAWFNILGAVLVLAGILMIIRNNNRNALSNKSTSKGVAFSVLAAVLWAGGAITLKIGLTGVDVYLASAIRVVSSAVILTGLAIGTKGPGELKLTSYSARNLTLVICAGVLTYGIGALGYVGAVQLIGAGKTVLLSASAPVFVLPLSMVFLKERPTNLGFAGLFISVAGICLVALQY
jgi:drug/metabolite transporter (DMT)-like permease